MTIKAGTRLQCQVCETQVIVAKSTDSLNDLQAGGAPMVPIGGPSGTGSPDSALADGT